jgi:hypothetical protein
MEHFVSDIASILVAALRDRPEFATICLLVLIGAVVMVALKADSKLTAFFWIIALAVVVVGGLAAAEISRQENDWRSPARVEIGETKDANPIAQRLSEGQKQDILIVLKSAAREMAGSLNLSPGLVRANVFAPDKSGRMQIVPGLTYNMERTEELTLSIPDGYGSTGRCFRSGKPNIAIFREGWGNSVIADDDLKKLDSRLQWIVSVPVKGSDPSARPIWVMNIDGLTEKKTEQQLQDGLRHLYGWSYALSIILSHVDDQIVRTALDVSVRSAEVTPFGAHSLINVVGPADIAGPTDAFMASTGKFTSIPPLNTFTKKTFAEEVRKRFVSYQR